MHDEPRRTFLSPSIIRCDRSLYNRFVLIIFIAVVTLEMRIETWARSRCKFLFFFFYYANEMLIGNCFFLSRYKTFLFVFPRNEDKISKWFHAIKELSIGELRILFYRTVTYNQFHFCQVAFKTHSTRHNHSNCFNQLLQSLVIEYFTSGENSNINTEIRN